MILFRDWEAELEEYTSQSVLLSTWLDSTHALSKEA